MSLIQLPNAVHLPKTRQHFRATKITRAALLALLALCPSLHAADTTPLTGKYSLQGGSPKTEGHLRVSSAGKDPLTQHLDLWMTTPPSATPIRNYAVEMTKKLHVVIVSSDFARFMHIHPTLSPTGHFVIDQQFPAPGLYYVYADGEPNNLDHQVFRFEVAVSNSGSQKPITLSPTGREVNIGPYTVDLSQVKLNAGGMDMIDVHILKGDKPATDLHPYLGASAHAVFLNGKDLSYVHVHPMSMGGADMAMSGMNMKASAYLPDNAPSSPDMMLHISIKEPGTYKMWLQFRGGSQLYVAPFVLTAQ
ncbi:hypothetical protein [Granulicella sp. dw_53]|uniref:hypothetical protein n=1 Tax=Granulicella sp. dw_53 TaxID=2719792 RepID=UPI001BD4AD3B|nr:hypothetical protein [Granulicella sp. dw_53]